MSDVIVQVESLSKRYILGQQSQERYQSFRDVIGRRAKAILHPFRRSSAKKRAAGEEFWALKDVSFEIRQGDRVGVIGRNGAGKSTLLKVLSRITEPTYGRIGIRGRVASLLEVGTGFHPELTGRENIYLNGAILGMSRVEIRRKFDEIVSFAEVEKFLDTPVKRYSSGMYVRLAFAVAAHLEPEILVVDEVLAVGDATFQKKCLGKMQEVSTEGRTILFVSHNSSAIASLCDRGLVLDKGQVRAYTSSLEALSLYNNELNQNTFSRERELNNPHIQKVELDQELLDKGTLKVNVHFQSPWDLNPPIVGMVVSSLYGMPLFGTNPRIHTTGFEPRSLRSGVATMQIDHLPLHSGSYKISVWLGDSHQDYDSIADALTFDFIAPQFMANLPSVDIIGPFNIPARWRLENDAQRTVYV